MSNSLLKVFSLTVIVLGSWLVQTLTTVGIIAYVPAIFLIAILITWTMARSWPYIVVVALIAELYTTLPPGFMTITVVTPLLVYRLRSRIEPDLSFSFLGLMVLTVTLQVSASFAYDLSQTAWNPIPWQLLGTIIAATSLVAYISSLGLLNFLPQGSQPVISFDSYSRYGRRH